MPRVSGSHVAHVALAAAALVTVLAEWAQDGATNGASPVWLTIEVAVMGGALLVAWWWRHQLRLAPVLAITALSGLAIVLVHDRLGIPGDTDLDVYATQGNLLIGGDYPHSEYPVGAVLLFGLDALIGGNSVVTTHGLVMIPFHVATVAAVWLLGTSWSPWLATVVALDPANLMFVHLRFEPLAAAALVAALLLAFRERWLLAGVLLGVGATAKWSPALACLTLFAWLLASRRSRDALLHAAGFVGALLVLYVPFLVWQADDVVAAYTTQSMRGLIAESLPYLPLRLVGVADLSPSGEIWEAATVPGWADPAATVAQLLLVAAIVALAVRVRGDLHAGVAVAALAPAVFLLTNRVFSPQFALVMLVTWAVAASLLVRSEREQLGVGTVALAATWANAMVFPGYADPFELWSTIFFGLSLGLTGWLVFATLRHAPAQRMIGTVPPSTDQAAPVT